MLNACDSTLGTCNGGPFQNINLYIDDWSDVGRCVALCSPEAISDYFFFFNSTLRAHYLPQKLTLSLTRRCTAGRSQRSSDAAGRGRIVASP